MKKMKLFLASLAIAFVGASSASAYTVNYVDSYSGQDFNNSINSVITDALGAGIQAVKVDGTSGTNGDLSVTTNGGTLGTWSFDVEPDEQVVGFSLKAGNGFALYSVVESVGVDISGEDWSNASGFANGSGITNNKGNPRDLSHFVVYYTTGNPTGGPAPTPTPDAGSTLAFMGSALAGLGLLKRRK